MRILSEETGPLIEYENGILHIEDLNPHQLMRWRMTRGELWRMGWRCIVAALRG
jgi:hypothetical protein